MWNASLLSWVILFFFNFWWKMILKIWLINLLFSVKKQNEKKKRRKGCSNALDLSRFSFLQFPMIVSFSMSSMLNLTNGLCCTIDFGSDAFAI